MAEFTNEQQEEIKSIVMETLTEEGEAIEDLTEVNEMDDTDVFPIVRTSNGVKEFAKVSYSTVLGSQGARPRPDGGGSGVTVVNDLTTGGETNALSAEMGKVLKGMIDAISSGAVITMTISPTVIYKGTATNVTVGASVSGVTPATLKIMDGSTEIASVTDNANASAQRSVNTTDSSKTFTSEATYNGITFTDSVTLYARYPIYCGMGASAAAVGVDANKIGATTTAVRTYQKTASANGQYFFLLIPSDITDVSMFSMGGAPFAMEAVSTTTIGSVTYRVHRSSYAYNSGTELNVKAE